MTDDNNGGGAPPAAAPAAVPADNLGGGRAEVPNSGGGAAAPPAPAYPEFGTLVPPEYKEKSWVKETKDVPSLFKRVDGLLAEMGKRPAGIPQENATPEEWTNFNKSFGVPEKAEDYKLTEGTKEAPVDPKFQTGIKGVFHKAGVSARQAAVLEKGYNELLAQLQKDGVAAGQQSDVDFDKLAVDTFGNRKDEAIAGARVLISKFAPETMKSHVPNLPNESLIIMAGILDAVRKEYISEDRMPAGGGVPAGMTAEQKRAKGLELMGSKAYQDPFDPDHDRVKKEVQQFYGTG